MKHFRHQVPFVCFDNNDAAPHVICHAVTTNESCFLESSNTILNKHVSIEKIIVIHIERLEQDLQKGGSNVMTQLCTCVE
jgi:hypothetical protein